MKKEETGFDRFPTAELTSVDGLSSLRFCAIDYAFPETTERGDDADWQKNEVAINIPGIGVRIEETVFQGHWLEIFLGEFKKLLSHEREEMHFGPTEPYFGLIFSYDQQKEIVVDASVDYPHSNGARLEFTFRTDAVRIKRFTKGIEAILERFPSRWAERKAV